MRWLPRTGRADTTRPALPIDDGDPCTQDTCDPQTGVMHASLAYGAGCVDGQGRGGTCDPGSVCFPTSDPAHEDGNPCTYDHAGGHDLLAGYSCEDGDLCNGAEVCSASGECLAGVAPVVDDGDVATLDMCDALVGVVHKAIPVLDRKVPTRIAASNAFLYQQPDPLQIGVETTRLVDNQVAVVHGKIKHRDGTPLDGVRITVHGHDEYGRTNSRPDGKFDLVVGGGGPLTVQYRKAGFLPVDRLIATRWRRDAVLDDVVMITADTEVTEVTTDQPGIQLAIGSVQTDEDGSRRAVLAFAGDTHATAELPNGTTAELDTLHVRATEYSVGETGPEALPAKLPEQTAYTYAVELSVDEAEAMGAERVQFDKPVRMYVDNFLHWRAGTKVPTGTYDRAKAHWVPVENGVVLDVLDVVSGMAIVDATGDGTPETEAELSEWDIDVEELYVLGGLYAAGESICRMRFEHFSPQASGTGFGPPQCAVAPGGKSDCDGSKNELPMPHRQSGPSLSASQPIAGYGGTLEYTSARMEGDERTNRVTIPMMPEVLPAKIRQVVMKVAVAGRAGSGQVDATAGNLFGFEFDGQDTSAGFDPATGVYTFEWDGKDNHGKQLQGERPIVVEVGYVYACELTEPEKFGLPGGANKVTIIADDENKKCHATLWRVWQGNVGAWDPKPLGTGGFTISEQHSFDVDSGMLYLGSGQSVKVENVLSGARVFAGGDVPGISDDLLPARDFLFGAITDLAVAPDKSVYVADAGNKRIVRIRPDGMAETVHAGIVDPNGYTLRHLALGPDGSLYYTTWRQVWRLTPGGITSPVMGDGNECTLDVKDLCADFWGDEHNCDPADDEWLCGNGADATQVQSNAIHALAVDWDGSVIIGDTTRQWRQVLHDGYISRIAGLGLVFPQTKHEDDYALSIDLRYPSAGELASDGSLVFVESLVGEAHSFFGYVNVQLRRLGTNGIVTTLVNVADARECGEASDNGWAEAGDGEMSTEACLVAGSDVAFGPDGSTFVQDYKRIRKINAQGVITSVVMPNVWEWGQPHCDVGEPSLCYQNYPHPIVVDGDGTLYWVNGTYNQRVMRMEAGGLQQNDEIRIPSPAGGEVYVFDKEGTHLRTEHFRTGELLRDFTYGANKKLVRIEDSFGNHQTIDWAGDVMAGTTNTFSQATALAVSSDGILDTATNPIGQQEHSGTNGTLVTSTTGPNTTFTAEYDPSGALRKVTDPTGGFLTFDNVVSGSLQTLTITANDKRTTELTEEDIGNGQTKRTSRGWDGLTTTTIEDGDGGTVTTAPNGMTTTVRLKDDDQYGEAVKYVGFVETVTPVEGKKRTVVTHKEVTFETAPTGGTSGAGPEKPNRIRETTNVNGNLTQTGLDLETGLLEVVSPEGRESQVQLDALGRVHTSYTPKVHATSYVYTATGQVERSAQGSRALQLEYDAYGHVVAVKNYNLEGVPYFLERTFVRYQNDEIGRPHKINLAGTWDEQDELNLGYEGNNLTSFAPPSTDAYTTSYVSEWLPDILTEPNLDEGTTNSYLVDRDYNEFNQLSKLTLPSEELIQFEYEPTTGRLKTIEAPDRKITHNYDITSGMLTSLTANDGTSLSFEYDGDLLLHETSAGVTDGEVSWEYYNDFKTSKETVSGHTVEFIYDLDGLATRAGDLRISHDQENGRVTGTSIQTGTGASIQTATDEYQYNAYNEPDWYTAKYNGTTVFQVHRQSIDDLGRVVRETQPVRDENGDVVERTYQYTYDLRGRIKKVEEVTLEGPLPQEELTEVESYGYDPNGNRTTPPATYDAQDRLLEDGRATYTHDRNGSLETREIRDGGEVITYDHDVFGRLRSVTSTGKDISYQLDPRGRRVAKYVNGALAWTALYRSDTQLVELRTVSENNEVVVTRFVYGLGRNVPDYMQRGGQTYRLFTDLRGSVRMVINVKTGAVEQRINYDAWGNILGPVDENAPRFQPFGFAGGLFDVDTGLVHFGSRDYDPSTGRWTSKDPMGFSSGSTNLYLYANGDPVNLVDPGGHFAIAPVILFAMAASAPVLVAHSSDAEGHFAMADVGLAAGSVAELGLGALRLGGGIARLARSGLGCAVRGACPTTTRYFGIRLCFAGDTPVSTAEGPEPIEEIEAGDLVWARDDATGRTELRPVKRVIVTPDQPLLALVVEHGDGTTEELRSTEEHPFATPSGGWIAARLLQPGDELVTADGAGAHLAAAWTELGTHTVYNLEIEGSHTYFVGDGRVWVHNVCGPNTARAGGQFTRGERTAAAIHDEYLRFVRPGAAGKTVRSSTTSSSGLGKRIFDDWARINGQRVGFEANTTPWARMTRAKQMHKLEQVGKDIELLSEGEVDRVIWFGTKPLPSSGLGGELGRALEQAGIEYWVVPW